MKGNMRRKKKKTTLQERLTSYEISRVYKTVVFTGPGSRYRIPFRFNKDEPRKSRVLCIQRRVHG